MKFRLHFKTPDALHYAIEDLGVDEKEAIEQLASKWIQYGESITIEIDTDEQTCVVVEA